MNMRDISNKLTPQMVDRAIKVGTKGNLLIRVASCTALSQNFQDAIKACVEGAETSPLGSSNSPQHHLAKTALIGGIQMGMMLALLASGEDV